MMTNEIERNREAAARVRASMAAEQKRQQARQGDEAGALRLMLEAFPVILRALNRKNVLTEKDRNDIRYMARRLAAGEVTLLGQIERAMDPKPSDAEDKKKRLGES